MSARLHIVTGKGGTGKTTIATALALGLARDGAQVLLVEVEGRQGIASALGVPELGTTERVVADRPGGGCVYGLSVDPVASLGEYLAQVARLGPASAVLERTGAIEFATSIAPGLRDVLLVGKVYEAARRTERHRRSSGGAERYDAVVLDAPPTGRIGRFLRANEELADLARVGPVREQADTVAALLRSERTALHIVTLLEEMPVREAAEGVAELRAAGFPVTDVVVNRQRTEIQADAELAALLALTGGEIEPVELGAELRRAGLEVSTPDVDALLDLARAHLARLALEDELLEELDPLGLPVIALPEVSGGLDRAALDGLAALLAEDLTGEHP